MDVNINGLVHGKPCGEVAMVLTLKLDIHHISCQLGWYARCLRVQVPDIILWRGYLQNAIVQVVNSTVVY